MIKKSKSEPTNQDLANLIKGQDARLERQDAKLEGHMDFMLQLFKKIDDRFNEMQQQVIEFKDGVYDKMDAVYKEVLTFRDEQTMHQGGHDRIQESVDDHEKRLKKLERTQVTAHQIRK